MKIITDTNTLAETCSQIGQHEFVTVDTEFLRESTFWPELCLIQLGWPDDAVIVDVLAPGIDLQPFFDLMSDSNVMKVFHAARQDIEIIYKLGGLLPHPVFDTQVAAMVCGFGDSISYDQLVYKITGKQIDKSSRFTDWKKRPLSEKQLKYALGDVTHLRQVYQSIKANLQEQNRSHWVSEEMEILTSVETYDMPPENAWRRLKMRVRKPRQLAVMQSVAQWREETARANNVPRGRVIKDDAIYDVAGNPPKNLDELNNRRGLQRGFDKRQFGDQLLQAVLVALNLPEEDLPQMPKSRQAPEGTQAATEMLKVLLKLVASEEGVAAKIIATVDDLERIASDDNAPVDALKGWRRELFGNRALGLKRGEMAIGFRNGKIQVIDLVEKNQAAAE